MPARRKTKAKKAPRRARKAAPARKRRGLRPTSAIYRPIGYPEMRTMRHRYCQTVALTSTAGALGQDKWYTNGMYQPYVAGGSHQPYGFDQMLEYYNYARVTHSRMTVLFIPQVATVTIPVMVGIQAYASEAGSSPFTTWETMKESGVPMKLIGATPTRPMRLSMAWSFAKNFRSSDSIDDTVNTDAGNPGRKWTYEVWIQSQDNSSTSASYDALIQIDYTVIWSDRSTLGPSSKDKEPVQMVFPITPAPEPATLRQRVVLPGRVR